MYIPFSPPDMSEREAELVKQTILSGWITSGPKKAEFEEKLSQYCGSDKTCAFNSATAALELALRYLNVGVGDEVIVPAYTYTASCSVICHVGATPVMVDCKKGSFEMDYDLMEAAISDKTKVIIPVDLGGVVCDYERIFKAVENKKALFKPNGEVQQKFGRVVILSDCAHGFGAERYGKKTGAIADFTSFSFHAVKNLTTAEGGALTWKKIDGIDSEEIYNYLCIMSLHGQTKSSLSKNKPGAWEYDIIAPYYKCNMTDIAAAIGLAQLERYDDMLARRYEVIEMYDNAFKGLGVSVLKHKTADQTSSGHLYLVRVDGINEAKRNQIIEKMAEVGIACNVHYKPLPMLTAYKNLGFDIKDYPNAYACYESEITLPLYSRLTNEQVDYIIQNFVRCVEEVV
ncbi:MAG: DegT/DnrJ/EryC1/StrS aminotransferase family protein [Clostridia bacterium]|nr:DegT/DnrJ/EryC1/StrS aminotransferase family protein [Clostridia bacterium]